ARLEEARRCWQEERAVAAAAAEPLARTWQDREEALAARDTEQRLRQEEIHRHQRYLYAWQAHLDCRAAAWDAERERLLADLQSWEEANAAVPAEERDLTVLRQKVFSLQARVDVYEQQISDLNDAVERLAGALLDECEP